MSQPVELIASVTSPGPDGQKYTALAAEVAGKLESEASRQRSASPWTYTIRSQQAIGSMHSNAGSGFSTPVGRRYRVSASVGATGQVRSEVARQAAHDNALLKAVKTQIGQFEDKVSSQIRGMQNHQEKVKEAAISRLEDKVSASEHFKPEIERRIAGLTGNFQGLSEEMSSQIRRVDSMDERWYEFKHQIEQDYRHKLSDFEQKVDKIGSTSKVCCTHLEDMQKKQHSRLERLEQSNDGVDGVINGLKEEIRAAFVQILNRVGDLEERCAQQDEASQAPGPSHISDQAEMREEMANASAMLKVIERRIGDLNSQIGQVEQDSSQLHLESKSHEEQLKSLRSLLEAREEKFRSFMGTDVEARLEQLRRRLEEDGLQNHEKLEIAMKRLESQEQAMEHMRDRQIEIIGYGGSTPTIPPCDFADTSVAEDCVGRLETTDTRLCSLEARLEEQALRQEADAFLSDKVGDVVGTLQTLVPKVIEVDSLKRDLEALQARMDEVLRRERTERILEDVEALKASVTDIAVREESITRQMSATMETLQAFQAHVHDAASKEEVSTMLATVAGQIEAQSGTVKTLVEENTRLLCLESDIAGLKEKSYCATHSEQNHNLRQELSSNIKQVQDECKILAGDLKIVEGMKEELRSLKCHYDQAQHVTKPQLDEATEASCRRLREEIILLMPKAASTESSVSIEVRKDVEDLRVCVNAITEEHNRGRGSASPLLDLMPQGEDERKREQRLLDTIDELCRQIAAVDTAVGKCVPLQLATSDSTPPLAAS